MGLAYDLNVSTWDNFGNYLSYGLIDLANMNPFELSIREGADAFGGPDWMFRFCGYQGVAGSQDTQFIYPTGEYIIRDITFSNGMYVFVGSYKAYFRDLFGVGNHGYAWDGFIMSLRGYSQDLNLTAPFLYNRVTKAYTGLSNVGGMFLGGWGFMPMRMPMDISPGVIGDATAIANDNSVGIQAVDVWKPEWGVEVGAGSGNFGGGNVGIVAVGYQKVGNSVTQGMGFTDVDYVGFVWNSMLLSYENIDAPLDPAAFVANLGPMWPYVGGDPRPNAPGGIYNANSQMGNVSFSGGMLGYFCSRQSTYQTSWRCTSNYSCPIGLGTIVDVRKHDLDSAVGQDAVNSGGSGPFQFDFWVDGYNAKGISSRGAPAITSMACVDYGVIPRKFLDVCSYSLQQMSSFGGQNAPSSFLITGDMSMGGDNSGGPVAIASTVPMVLGCSLPYDFGTVSVYPTPPPGDKTTFSPFMIAHCAGVSARQNTLGGVSAWNFEGTFTATNSFDGAYGAFCQVAYEWMSNLGGTTSPSGLPPLNYFAVNGITDSLGNTNAGLFISLDVPQSEGMSITSIIAPNQNPSPSTVGLPKAPKKWYAKAMQSRTFTVGEEARAKIINYYEVEFGDELPIQVINARTGEPVGVFGNYQRYGLDDTPPEQTALKQMGSASRQGFGFLGWDEVDGPIVVMYDSGRGWYKQPFQPPPNFSNPASWENVVLNVGDRFNKSIEKTPDVVNRKAISAGWDNDRDQWIYIFSDPTDGESVVSVTSTFTDTVERGSAYLDQTENFQVVAPLPTSNYQTAIWNPFLMTNELDGIVLFGGDDATNSKTGNIFTYTGTNPSSGENNKWWIYPVTQTTTTQTPPADWGSQPGPGTIVAVYSNLQVFTIKGTTGRTAKVWVDYILFDGADALIATKLREKGMKVTIEAVEWFKRILINKGDLNIKQEEIEMWMREQQDEFQQMMSDAERQGRVRKRKKQVSAYGLNMLETLNTDFEDKEIQEFMKEYLPQSRPPTPEEQALEKQRKGGYSPESKSYFDEVFEN